MLSRQESSLSSSRRQAAAAATPPPETHHAKAIGCMSGILRLFSKYQNPNKRITFGRKQEKGKKPQSAKEDKTEKQNFDTRRLSCEINVPRSPTLPLEIRQTTSANSSESPRTPSSLVARLMGLEEITVKKQATFDEDGIVEKRRQLLQALEKCNDDLEELKRIIQGVQSVDLRLQPSQKAAEKGNLVSCVKKCTGVGVSEELSPVCVLDEFTRSPLSRDSKVQNDAEFYPVNLKTMAAKKLEEDDEHIVKHPFFSKYSAVNEASLIRMRRAAMASPPRSSSRRAMVESVEEVCKDIAWGEKREIKKIGLVLQDNLCKDLVEEVVRDLKSCGITYSIPLERCKRRLSF